MLASACSRAEPPKTGGFSKVEIDGETRAVAVFASQEISKTMNEPLELKGVASAERQVVAGLNYRLALDVTKNNRPFPVRAVVWRKLDGTMELTSWNPI